MSNNLIYHISFYNVRNVFPFKNWEFKEEKNIQITSLLYFNTVPACKIFFPKQVYLGCWTLSKIELNNNEIRRIYVGTYKLLDLMWGRTKSNTVPPMCRRCRCAGSRVL
jgi:hypothetical protein